MSDFIAGMKDYLRAWSVIRKHHLWPWLILPGLISLAYFPGIIAGTLFYFGDLEGYLREHWLPSILKQRVFSVLITIALWIASLYAGFILFRNVTMILYAPVLGYFSAKVEEKASGAVTPAAPVRFVHAALRAIGMSLLSLALSLAGLVFGLLLLLVPIAGGLLMTAFLTVFQMFLAGHGFLDPTFERHGYGVGRSIGVARRNRMRTMGCGCGFLLLTAIPVIGWFLGPTIGVAAGTLSALDLEAGSQTPV